MKPKRIQRKRTKGWRMPEGAVYVGRPTRWGNPFRDGVWTGEIDGAGFDSNFSRGEAIYTHKLNFLRYRLGVNPEDARKELRGKDLACWCPLDQPCHADILLEIANVGVESDNPFATLSPRERQILMRLTAGRTNAQLAVDLRIPFDTVKMDLVRIYRKLGAKNRTQAAVMAWTGMVGELRVEVVEADETFDTESER